MNPKQIEDRKNKIENSNKDYIKVREDNKLSLRKNQINEYLKTKRDQMLKTPPIQKHLEISVESLNLPTEITSKIYDNLEIFCLDMKSLFTTSTTDIIKFALLQIRMQSKSKTNTEVLYKNNIVDCVMMLLSQYLNDKTIIYLSLQILINISQVINYVEFRHFILNNSRSLNLFENIWEIGDDGLNVNILYLFAILIKEPTEERLRFCNCNFLIKCILPYSQTILSFSSNTIQLYTEIILIVTFAIEEDELNNKNIIKDKDTLTVEITKIHCNFLFENETKCINSHCIIGLSKISCFSNNHINNIIFSSGIIGEILKREKLIPKELLSNALILIGNFLSETPKDKIEPFVSEEILSFLSKQILTSKDKDIKTNAFWSLSNITFESCDEFAKIFENGVVEKIVESVEYEAFSISKEALYCLTNILTSQDANMILKIAKYNIMQVLVSVVQKFENNENTMMLIIECLYGLFEFGEVIKEYMDGKNIFVYEFCKYGGKDILERLQGSKFKKVYQVVADLIQKFFETN